MMPGTRARTSTSLEPAVCAGYSNSTGMVFGFTSCTATTAGGKPPGPPGGPLGPQPAISAAERTRRVAPANRGLAVYIVFLFTGGRGKGDNLHTVAYVCQMTNCYRDKKSSRRLRRAMARRTKEEAQETRTRILDAAEQVFYD